MKQYTFSFSKEEIKEFCMQAFLEQMRRQVISWIAMLVICLLEALADPRISAGLIAILAIIVILTMVRSYAETKKKLLGKERTVWVEENVLKVQAGICSEVPCSSINRVKVTKHLLMLGLILSRRQASWIPIPRRVFENEQEMEAFINMVRGLQTAAGKESSSNVRQEENLPEVRQNPEYFHFSHEVNEEKYLAMAGGAAAVVRSGALGVTEYHKTLLFIYGVAILLACTLLALTMGTGEVIALLVLILGVMAVTLLKTIYGNPKKSLRRQMSLQKMKDNVCGTWNISIREDGVTETGATGVRNFVPWEKMGCLVETENFFYVFTQDKKGFMTIPKECLEDPARAEEIRQLFQKKQIALVETKKRKYLPGWFFFILYGVVAVLFMLAIILTSRTERRDSGQTAGGDYYYYEPEPFDPDDYENYVPLEEQAERLRQLGLTVPEELVDSIKDRMMEYDMQRYAEGYPYTWLLQELGAPKYDENWNISGYCDEVFWFDFEGMDISTDYVEILEGMLALDQDSVLDGVTGIYEDVTNVDWDKGTGTAVVALAWKGQEYTWQMEVEYDWIDPAVLGIFNSLLEKENAKKRFYVTGDDGQGAIVFFADKKWAQQFGKVTGLSLETMSAEPSAARIPSDVCRKAEPFAAG